MLGLQDLLHVWTLCCFVLVMAFAGNLTAMITRPKFDMKINNFKDILYQDEIGLVVQDELIRGGELEQYPADSPKRRALEQAQIIPLASLVTGCFDNDTYYSRKHASYCDIQSILEILSEDFSNSGKCNWYEMKHDGLETNPMAMAFQVNQS